MTRRPPGVASRRALRVPSGRACATSVRYARRRCAHTEVAMSHLKSGSAGGSVQQLQEQLQAIGYQVDVDGKYGPITEAAVRAFQQKVGLQADGIAGPDTLTELLQASSTGGDDAG